MTGITSVEGITRIGRSKRNDVEYYIVTVWILRGKLTRVKLILHFTYTALLPDVRIISRARLFSIVVSSSNEPELYREGTRVERWFRISNIFVTRICTVLSCILFSHEYGIENRSIELYKFDSKRYSRIILRLFSFSEKFRSVSMKNEWISFEEDNFPERAVSRWKDRLSFSF